MQTEYKCNLNVPIMQGDNCCASLVLLLGKVVKTNIKIYAMLENVQYLFGHFSLQFLFFYESFFFFFTSNQ